MEQRTHFVARAKRAPSLPDMNVGTAALGCPASAARVSSPVFPVPSVLKDFPLPKPLPCLRPQKGLDIPSHRTRRPHEPPLIPQMHERRSLRSRNSVHHLRRNPKENFNCRETPPTRTRSSSKTTGRAPSTKFPSPKSPKQNSPSSTCTRIPTRRLTPKSPLGSRTWTQPMLKKPSSSPWPREKNSTRSIQKYSKYPDRFELWCGLDLTAIQPAGFRFSRNKELERCHDAGARGIGEIHDKGKGLQSGKIKAPGMHPDDPRMDAVWEKAAELHMPDQPPRRRPHLDVSADGQA